MNQAELPVAFLRHFEDQPPVKLIGKLGDAAVLQCRAPEPHEAMSSACIVIFKKQDEQEIKAIELLMAQQPRRKFIVLFPNLSVPNLKWCLDHRVEQGYMAPPPAIDLVDIKCRLNPNYQPIGHQQRHTHEKLRQTLELIEQRFGTPLSLQQLAHEVSISDSRLCHLFNQYLGIKFSNYLLCRRLEAAPDLLRDDGLSVAAIAYRLNFSTPSHFCRSFKQHLGLTPTEYRQLKKSESHSKVYHQYLKCRQPEPRTLICESG